MTRLFEDFAAELVILTALAVGAAVLINGHAIMSMLATWIAP